VRQGLCGLGANAREESHSVFWMAAVEAEPLCDCSTSILA